MKYEQRVINGVLHHRTDPSEQWQPLTAEQLTTLLLDSRRRETTIVSPVYTPPLSAPVEYYTPPTVAPVVYYNIPAWVPDDHNQPYRHNRINCANAIFQHSPLAQAIQWCSPSVYQVNK